MNNYSINQNFLKKADLVSSLIAKANFQKNDIILDIGSGKGIIAQELAKISNNVTAIEIDPFFHNLLKSKFEKSNIKIVNEDFLKFKLPNKEYSVFSNIPFNQSANIIKKLLGPNSKLKTAYIIMQKEAAEKFGGDQLKASNSLLSLIFMNNYKFEIIHKFSSADFEPRPRVETVLIKINKRNIPLISEELFPIFTDFVSYIFTNSQPYIQKCIKLFSFIQFQKFETTLKLKKYSTPSEVSSLNYRKLFEFMMKFDKEKVKVVKGAYHKLITEQGSLEKVNRTRINTKFQNSIISKDELKKDFKPNSRRKSLNKRKR